MRSIQKVKRNWITVVVSSDLKRRISQAAERDRRTVSDFARYAIVEFLEIGGDSRTAALNVKNLSKGR